MEVNVAVAFISGVVSFFAPCMIPLVPAYLAYVSGVSLREFRGEGSNRFRKRLWLSTGLFVLGFSVVFVAMGVAVAGLASFVAVNKQWLERVGGLILVLFGLYLGGWWRWSRLDREYRLQLPRGVEKLGYVKPVLIGMVFAGAWTPCVGPVLGAILTLAAVNRTVYQGAGLLLVYSLGVSLPFILLAGAVAQSPRILSRWRYRLTWMEKVFGLVLVLLGVLLLNNSLGWISDGLTYDGLNRSIFSWLHQMGYRGF